MLTRTKKFIGISAATTALVLGGVMVFSNMNNVIAIKGHSTDSLSVTFNKNSTVESGSISSGSVVLSTPLEQSGIRVRATINGDPINIGSNIARLTTNSHYVTFSIESNSSGVSGFKNITGVQFTLSNTVYNEFYVNYSNTSETELTSQKLIDAGEVTSASVELDGAKNISITPYSGKYAYIFSITINYSCSDPTPGEKTLTSINVTDTKKVMYAVGDTFVEPEVTAHYSDSTSEVVSGAIFTGFDSSSTTESQTIGVSYEGKSTSYTVKVRPTTQSIYISYFAKDVYDGSSISFDDSGLTKYASPNDVVTFNAPSISGYTFNTLYPDTSCEAIWEQIESLPVASGTSFSMPSEDFGMTLYYDAILVLDSISVDSPKTEYNVGDTFVEPTVVATYTNGRELEVSGAQFSGFDSSAAAESQTITVNYTEGGVNKQTSYTISITSSGPEPSDFLPISGNYRVTANNVTYSLEFNSNGTGQYVYINSFGTRRYIIDFTYDSSSSSRNVTITLDENTTSSNITGYNSGWRIVNAKLAVEEWINDTGSIAQNSNSISIRLWSISAGVYSQNANATTFTLTVE